MADTWCDYDPMETNGSHTIREIPPPAADPFASTRAAWPRSTFAPRNGSDALPTQGNINPNSPFRE
jgi:hypothetical protein